jgi:hypothetical protein
MEDVEWNHPFRIGNWLVLLYTLMWFKKYKVHMYALKAYGKVELGLHSL